MSHYRRWYVPGGTYFFTVVAYRRHPLFESALARALLGEAMREVNAELPFETVAIVLLHDHLHAVWTLPRGDADYSKRWKKIKAAFTTKWLGSGGREMVVTRAQERRGNRGVWQKRFHEHVVDNEHELQRVCDYDHYNPVRHRYVERPWDWLESSFRRFVEAGEYERGWGRTEPETIAGLDFE